MSERTVLHVGCGMPNPELLHPFFRTEGWKELRLDIDPDVKPDIVNSIVDMHDVEDESVDAVWSSHNLEHIHAHEVPLALREFHRVIKPDGFVLIAVPDAQTAAAEIAQGNIEGILYQSPAGPVAAIDMLYGLRAATAENPHMCHKTAFTAQSLAQKLSDAGFLTVRTNRDRFNLWAIAGKQEGQFQGPIPTT